MVLPPVVISQVLKSHVKDMIKDLKQLAAESGTIKDVRACVEQMKEAQAATTDIDALMALLEAAELELEDVEQDSQQPPAGGRTSHQHE